jgi:F0F1-type ATP synthase delta subunit
MNEESSKNLIETMRNVTGRDVKMKFDVDQKLISGIELSANNIRIGWNIAGYLDDLKSDLSLTLGENIAVKKAI